MGGGGLRGGREERAVHDPAAGDAEAEAQARTEGRDEDDVRKGGAGGSEARQEGGEGLPCQGPEGLHLRPPYGASHPCPQPSGSRVPGEVVLLVVMPRRMLCPCSKSGI